MDFINYRDSNISNPDHKWLKLFFKTLEERLHCLTTTNRLVSSEGLQLALQLKQAMEEKNITTELLEKFQSIKNKLPQSVRILAFGEPVFIVNKRYSEYFYASSSSRSKNKRGRVRTWLKPHRLDDPQGLWEFQARDYGKTFLIKSLYREEYLVADTDSKSFDEERRNIGTWRGNNPVNGMEWSVEFVNDQDIEIKNIHYGEQIYATGDEFKADKDRRRVFTWRPETIFDGSKFRWNLVPNEFSNFFDQENSNFITHDDTNFVTHDYKKENENFITHDDTNFINYDYKKREDTMELNFAINDLAIKIKKGMKDCS